MEEQLDQLEDAGVNPRMVHMVSDQPTVEEILETLLELKKAVYYRRWERLLDAALNGEDFSGPASDDEDVSGPRAKRRRVQAGHNSSGPPE